MSTASRPIVELRAPIELKQAMPESTARRFEIRAYTGKVINSWFGGFVIDIAGMQTKPKVPILREHERDRIVGWSEETRKEKDGLYLSGVFSDSTPDGREVLALADEGFPWQASVGIKPLQIKILKNANESQEVNGKRYNGPLEIWTKTLVGETSMVSWGADNDTGMSLLSENGRESVPVEVEPGGEPKGERKMNLEEFRAQHADLYEQVFRLGARSIDPKLAELQASVDGIGTKVAEAKQAGISEERARCVKLLDAKADAEATLKAIKEGAPAAEAFEAFFMAEREARAKKLADFKESLPESAGASGKPSAQAQAEAGAPDFMAEVKEYMEAHKCSEAEAVRKVQKANPDLHAKWLAGLKGGK